MNNLFRTGILLIILAIPVFIFLFLKGCGENYFTIPVFYENSWPEDYPDSCKQSDLPFLINDTKRGSDEKIRLYSFASYHCTTNSCREKLNQLARVSSNFNQYDEVEFITLIDTASQVFTSEKLPGILDPRSKWLFEVVSTKVIANFLTCSLAIFPKGPAFDVQQTVLTDKEGRIRGYYQASDREDMDRLITELNILIQKYQ